VPVPAPAPASSEDCIMDAMLKVMSRAGHDPSDNQDDPVRFRVRNDVTIGPDGRVLNVSTSVEQSARALAPAPAPVRYEEDAAARAAMPPPPRRPPPLRGFPPIGVEKGIAKGHARRRVRVRVLQHAQKPGVIDRSTSRKSPTPPGGAERAHFRAIDELLHGLEPPCGAARPACLPWGDASLCDLYA